jgi:hypothetical protein
MTEPGISPEDIDRWTRHLLHTSQHNRMVIALGGRIQQVVDEMRAKALLPAFGWNTAFPDAEFGECTVHVEGCAGQESHERPPGESGQGGGGMGGDSLAQPASRAVM